ncbi:winged helix-turn-helix transcriptional regulator [Roseixanthobacter finlandensis]|uniref:winged helix-turn-helix transcriptional regulator n=1 Tax=Roseixanthobacter finlandensis TaxID=3119922 RepID=UPI004040C43C
MKRTRMDEATCPIARTLDVVGDWWSLLIVRDAFLGKRRFGEFQKSLGVAKNILSARLKTLVADGILASVPASDGSAFNDYVLTPKGRDLFPVVIALRQWGEKYGFSSGESFPPLVDAACGKPIAPLEVRDAVGKPLAPQDTILLPLPQEA